MVTIQVERELLPMSVEAGPGVGAAGPSFEATPTFGGIKSFGHVFESVAYSPIDRIVAKGDLENMTIIRFDQLQLKSGGPLKEDVAEVSIVEPKVAVTDGETVAKEIWSELTSPNNLQSLTADVLERALKAKAAVQPKTEVVKFQQTNTAPQEDGSNQLSISQGRVTTQKLEQKQEDINKKIEVFGIFPNAETTGLSPQEKDEVDIERRRIVRDGKALIQRITDGIKAVKRVFTDPKKEVTGRDVQIPYEYDEVRSTALKQEKAEDIPDGSYEQYKAKAEVRIADLTSPAEIARVLEEEAYENEPVKRDEGEREKRVGQTAVFKVFKYSSRKPPVEEFRIRVSKKTVGVVETEAKSGSTEKTIHEYPDLAEALQVA